MAFNIFGKKDKTAKKAPEKTGEVEAASETPKERTWNTSLAGKSSAYRILKSSYLSEKSASLNGFNQYVFKVGDSASKQEIKKQVGALYNVKVRGVKILNVPRKRKDVGRHPGFRSGFRKAIVILEAGQSISLS
ncbi:MAG: 50S ribosomal protein L23 [Candidatus Yanofskybacteria bacterium]|nr:50S ribosomal protein L23 [Candidatus Yanofskybacteria bacterium]